MPNDISDVNGICIANLSGESYITRAHVHYEQPQPVYIEAEPIGYQESSWQLMSDAMEVFKESLTNLNEKLKTLNIDNRKYQREVNLKEEFDAFTLVLEEKLSEYERRLGLI